MKRILLWLLGLLLLTVIPARSQTSLVNKASCGDLSGTTYSSFPCAGLNISAGNLVIGAVRWYDGGTTGTISGITSSAGDSVTVVGSPYTTCAVANAYLQFFYIKNSTANASTTLTVNFTIANSAQYISVLVRQWSGFSTTAPLDINPVFNSSAACGTSTTHATTGSFTTTAANELIWVAGSTSGTTHTWSASDDGSKTNADLIISGNAGPDGAGAMGDEYRFVSSIQTGQTDYMDLSSTGVWITGVVTFKASGTTSATPLGYFDKYQGIRGTKVQSCSPNYLGTPAFSVKRANGRWIFATPYCTAHFQLAIQNMGPSGSSDGFSWYASPGSTTGSQRVGAVIGNNSLWAAVASQQINSWKFNSVGEDALQTLWPINGTSGVTPYPTVNSDTWAQDSNGPANNGNKTAQAFKDILDCLDAYAIGAVPSGASHGSADMEDPYFQLYIRRQFYETTLDAFYGLEYTNPYMMTGFIDADYVQGVAGSGLWSNANLNSADGYIQPHLGWEIAVESPIHTASAFHSVIHSADTVSHAKSVWLAYICGGAGVYATIGALNTAWGSNYTSCGSSGTQTNGTAVGTGNGSTVTFAATLPHGSAISKGSVVIHVALPAVSLTSASRTANLVSVTAAATTNLVVGQVITITSMVDATFNGTYSVNTTPTGTTFTYKQTGQANASTTGGTVTPSSVVAGDLIVDAIGDTGVATLADFCNATCTIYGPATSQLGLVSGTIVRSTGALSVTFATAPPNTVAITADSCAGCWGVGTGLSDEAGAGAWTGNCAGAFGPLVACGVNATFLADADNFVYKYLTDGFSTFRTEFKAVAPNTILFSANPLNGHGGSVRPKVAKATGEQFDATIIAFRNQDQYNEWDTDSSSKPITIYLYQPAYADADVCTLTLDTAASSATRASNVVTVTTHYGAIHGENIAVGEWIIVKNMTDTSFNGTFQVATVPNNSSYTFSQNGPNASTTNGLATIGCPASAPVLATQAQRGANYISQMAFYLGTANGNYDVIGMRYWDWVDNWGEGTNTGMVTLLANSPYDGVNDTTAHTNATVGSTTFATGGEPAGYGDFIDSVISSNTTTLNAINNAFQPIVVAPAPQMMVLLNHLKNKIMRKWYESWR